MNPSPEERILAKVDREVTSNLSVGKTGSIAFDNATQVMEFAKLMAVSQSAVPKHLRENPGACLGVALQAMAWEMSPFAVANKSYVVNDRIAYEAQMINAVILRRAPIVGRFKISYSGEGPTRRCKVAVKLMDGDTVDYESPKFADIPVKNSPLWKSDPDQQLFYVSSRAMCRRHFPDVILGVYGVDELQDEPEREVTVISSAPKFLPRDTVEPQQEQAQPIRGWEEEPAQAQQEASAPAAEESTISAKDRLREAMESEAVRKEEVIEFLSQNDRWEDGGKWKDLSENQAAYVLENWSEVQGMKGGK